MPIMAAPACFPTPNIAISHSTLTNCYSYTAHAYGGALCAAGNITLNSTLSSNTTKGHFYYYYYPGYRTRTCSTARARRRCLRGQRFTITDSTITHNRGAR